MLTYPKRLLIVWNNLTVIVIVLTGSASQWYIYSYHWIVVRSWLLKSIHCLVGKYIFVLGWGMGGWIKIFSTSLILLCTAKLVWYGYVKYLNYICKILSLLISCLMPLVKVNIENDCMQWETNPLGMYLNFHI